jgi:toxic protein SymE
MTISQQTSQQSIDTQSRAAPESLSSPIFELRHLTIGESVVSDPSVSRHPSHHPRPTSAPHLRLAGRWLEKAGFAIGMKVRVEVSQGHLIIEPIPLVPGRSPHSAYRGRKISP